MVGAISVRYIPRLNFLKICILAVGKLRSGPEAELVADYLGRFDKVGRGLGLGPARVIEVEAKRSSTATEALMLERAIPNRSPLCILDENGTSVSSPELAKKVGAWRDQGISEVTFLIGGADGIDTAIKERADFSLSFGKMVWPHILARVMLAEQLYRAASILARSPYHRS